MRWLGGITDSVQMCCVLCLVTQLCPTLWTADRQVPLATGFSRQEYWSVLPCPPSKGSSQPRDRTEVSHIAGGFFTD